MKFLSKLILITLSISLILSACTKPQSPSTDVPPAANTTEIAATIEPTATEEEYAIKINAETISEQELNSEIKRVSDADALNGISRTDEERRAFAIDELIGRSLLAQDAYANGFSYTNEEHQARITGLISELGSEDALNQWLNANGYDPVNFQVELERALAAAFTRDRLIAQVPTSSKQYHVQELLLYDRPTAEYYYNQYLAGADFNTLAANIDPITRGDIGLFPAGYLPDPIIETAVTQMQVGQVSEIIEGKVGFYILKLLEVDENRELSPDALIQAQKKALNQWLEDQRENGDIIIR